MATLERSRFGAHLVGVLAGRGDAADRRRRRLLELVRPPDHADAVDLDDRAVLEQQRVEKRVFR